MPPGPVFVRSMTVPAVRVRGSQLVASCTGWPSALTTRSRTRISSPTAMCRSAAMRSSADSRRTETCTLGVQPPPVASVTKAPCPAERSPRLSLFRARRRSRPRPAAGRSCRPGYRCQRAEPLSEQVPDPVENVLQELPGSSGPVPGFEPTTTAGSPPPLSVPSAWPGLLARFWPSSRAYSSR